MVVRSFCGMMFGIQMGIYLTSMDTKFSMMLTDPLDLGCPRLLERENGSGLELDLINWCKSRVGCLKLELGGWTVCAQTWEMLRTKLLEVGWHKIVWFELAIPKHAFILWLVFRNALSTKERMCCWGYVGSTLCIVCFACQESRDHLFFNCSFSKRIWRRVIADCLIWNPPVELGFN